MPKKSKSKPKLHRVVAIRRLPRNQRTTPGRAIAKIRVQDTNGEVEEWGTDRAIAAMVKGTDAFFVVGVMPLDKDPTATRTVWSRVTPWPPNGPQTIRTVTDRKRPDNLTNLPRF